MCGSSTLFGENREKIETVSGWYREPFFILKAQEKTL